MREEKPQGVLEKNAHRFALGGQLVAVLSVLLLVPAIRKLREQRHPKHRRHFPILGH